MDTNELINIIASETRNDYILYCNGLLSRNDMNANLLQRRKLLLLII